MYQLFPESGNLGLVLPPALATWTLEKVKKGREQLVTMTTTLSGLCLACRGSGGIC